MIKAFEVTKKYQDLLADKVLCSFSFAIKDQEVTTDKEFPNLGTCNAYLEKAGRDWFLGCLEDYVNHKKHIIESGNHQDQMPALETCMNAVAAYYKMELKNIIPKFLNGRNWFVKILPSDNNPSYKNSLINLQELIQFCEKFPKTIS